MTDRKQWKTGLSIGHLSPKALERLAKAGVQVVEIHGLEEDSLWHEVPRWAADTGVEVRSLHLPFTKSNVMTRDPEEWKRVLDEYQRLFDRCAQGGVKILVAHPGNAVPPDAERDDYMKSSIEHMTVLTEKCKDFGLTLAVENMPNGLCRVASEAARFLEEIPDLRFCFDTNHLLRDSHELFIKTVGPRLVTTHVSDYDFVTEKHWFPLRGQIDWRNVQGCLEDVDYNGPLVYEVRFSGETWEDVRPNHELLKNL